VHWIVSALRLSCHCSVFRTFGHWLPTSDQQQIALCITQVIFSALADGGPSPATTADSLQRLLFDVFQRDVREFRRV
jgi:uncharacterized protein (DUF2267 family)